MDIPIVNTIPAIPGNVKEAESCAKIPRIKNILKNKARLATNRARFATQAVDGPDGPLNLFEQKLQIYVNNVNGNKNYTSTNN